MKLEILNFPQNQKQMSNSKSKLIGKKANKILGTSKPSALYKFWDKKEVKMLTQEMVMFYSYYDLFISNERFVALPLIYRSGKNSYYAGDILGDSRDKCCLWIIGLDGWIKALTEKSDPGEHIIKFAKNSGRSGISNLGNVYENKEILLDNLNLQSKSTKDNSIEKGRSLELYHPRMVI